MLTGSAGAATHPLGWGLNGDKQAAPVLTNVMDDATGIAAGYYHSLALKDGRAWTWGSSANGLTNVPLAAQSGVAAIAGGGSFSLALRTNGAVIGWGGGSAATNVPVSLTSGVAKISAGDAHGLAIQAGAVVAWGSNTYGQCDVPDSLTNAVTDIAAGGYFSVALKDGAVEVFGIPATNPLAWSIREVPPEASSGVTAIAAGKWHALALKDGGVIAWGVPHYDATNVPPAATSGVAAIAAGDCFSVALKTNGTLVAWGDDFSGQTIIPNYASNGVTAVAAGKGHVLAICAAMPPRFLSSVTPDAFRDYAYTNAYVVWAGDPAVTYHRGASWPSWLTLDANTGVLGGTPLALGTYSFAVVASNAFGRTTNSSFKVVVLEKPAGPPVFITTNLPGGTIFAPYDQTIAISNGGTLNIINGSLPAGLTMQTNGWISGTPTTIEAPQFLVRATNTAGASTQLFQIAISAPAAAPVFVSPNPLPSGVLGQPYSFQLETENYPTNFGVVSGALPAGLGVTAAGLITGTPTEAGTASFTLFASNLVGGAETNYSLHVNGPPEFITTSPLPDGVLGVAYNVQIEASDVNSFNLYAGELPAGLGLRTDGMVTGTPAVVGTSNFTVSAINDYGWATRDFALTIGAVPVFVTPSNLPAGTAGVAYVAVQIEATGATAYSLVGGGLPDGMNLSAAGLLDGTPQGAGPYLFTVRATNDSGYAERGFDLTVFSANTNLPFFTARPRYTNGVLYLGWTNPNAGGAVSIWRSTNLVGTNAAWSNLGTTATSPWSNAAPPMPSYYRLHLAP
ncbi:MAG: putative Ig domain-containing protein [Kiritimatiellia bacterium]